VRDPTVAWSSPDWLAEATDWIDERLAVNGARRTGPVEQVAPASVGDRPAGPHDGRPGLAQNRGAEDVVRGRPVRASRPRDARARARPARGRRRARGWLLLPDGGTRLGDRVTSEDLAPALCEVLPQHAELQRALAPSADAILELGAPDMRPQVMPQRFEEAMEATAGLAGRIAHAFACMLLPLTDVRNRADEDASLRLRDAYLEAWSDLAPHAELVETLELAVRVGWIARSHTWLRAVGDATGERWATAPLESLAGILDGP
jgi:hypothetical protein